MTRLLRATVLTALVVALVAVAAVPVLAAAPTRTSEEVHILGDFPAGTRCPFEVIRTIDGTLVTTVYTDADGLTRTTLSYRNATIRYLNPANGKTMFSPLAGPETSIDNGDGTT